MEEVVEVHEPPYANVGENQQGQRQPEPMKARKEVSVPPEFFAREGISGNSVACRCLVEGCNEIVSMWYNSRGNLKSHLLVSEHFRQKYVT
jgi:hypothetical protein